MSGRAGHAQHVCAHQVIRAAAPLGRVESSVRVCFTFELGTQTSADGSGGGGAVVGMPPSLGCGNASGEYAVGPAPCILRGAGANLPIVHDGLPHDCCLRGVPHRV